MKKKNIRSEYIKKLMEDKAAISSQLEETTKDTLKEILGESVSKELRNILNESDEDDFEEEEVETEEPIEDETTEENAETEEEATEDDVETEEEVETLEDDEVESSDDTENEDVWSSLEDLKGEDGEYDLTGMDKDDVIKVLKVMNPDEDGVRVVKNSNGSLTLTDEETDKEYIIDIDGDFDCEEAEIEVEIDDLDSLEESVNEDLGYTDNYQNKTAMTTPNNKEVANPKSTYSMDGGVPTGTEKPFAKPNKKAEPFNESEIVVEVECGDENEECQVDEAMTTQENGAYNKGTGMVHTNTNSKASKGRNASAGGQKISSTSDNSYSQQFENIKRKANAIFKENKELKEVLAQLKGKLEESIVINASLGKIIQLVTENTTSKDEKVNIVKRFNNVKTIQESRELYNTISNELKSVHNNTKSVVNESMDKQIAEGKNNNIIETSIYKSTDLSNTLDLMNRMMTL